jgi:dihydrofolate synthase/folylpolyglutamate synthase
MNFEEALQYLLSLGHETLAIKLGLRNTELLLESLGNPHKLYESVQIAGTNGKGSTAVMLDSICRAAAIPTGLYTSPHLISITERIVINGRPILEDDFARIATVVRAAAESLVAQGEMEALPTFFEHVTAIALMAFKETEVRLAILETGLGGRLDATTVAGAKTVAITPIALDHQEYLGETLAEIAGEKAAIIRPCVSALIAPQPQQALEVILQRSAEMNVLPSIDECRARIVNITDDRRFTATFETSVDAYENVLLGLRGRHQITNAGVAIRIAESLRRQGFDIHKASIIQGIHTARHGGRLELQPGSPALLFDGAHNTSGAQALRNYLDEFGTAPLTMIFGSMNDKKLEEIAAILFPAADLVILTRPDNPRSASVADLHRLATRILKNKKAIATQSAGEALQKAVALTPPNGLICVTGSLYLVGEIMTALKADALSSVAR